MPNELQLKYLDINKALAYTPPPELDLTQLPQIPPENWQDFLKQQNVLLNQYLDKHIGIGENSSYTLKSSLTESLKIIYYRLSGNLDSQLGQLSDNEKVILLTKLTECISECSAGFHDRAQEIINSFSKPKNFSQLLQLVREDLVQRMAAILIDEVHATNTIICIAHTAGYGVRPRNRNDEYFAKLTPDTIQLSLKKTFEKTFTPFHLPILICDQLRTLIAHVYMGKKSDTGYDVGDMKEIGNIIDQLLSHETEEKKIIHEEYFLKEEYNENEIPLTRISDVNWPFVQRKIFEKLMKGGYFVNKPIPETAHDFFYYNQFMSMEETIKAFYEIAEDFNDYCKTNSLFADLYNTPNLINNLWNYLLSKNEKDIVNISPSVYAVLSCLIKNDVENSKNLSEKRHLCWVVDALYNVVCTHNQDAVNAVIQLAKTIVEKCDAKQLAIGLAEKSTSDANGFFWLIHTLCAAVYINNPTAADAISLLTKTIVEKYDAKQLAIGLTKKRTLGNLMGTNGFYWLMCALYVAVDRNDQAAAAAISSLAKTIVEKCDTKQLAVGLAEKITHGGLHDTNGFYWLMCAFLATADKNHNTSPVFDLFFNCLTKLNKNETPSELKKQITDGKNTLRGAIVAYIEAHKNDREFLSEKCHANTMLGVLIDTHTLIGFFQTTTNTRKMIGDFIKKLDTNTLNSNFNNNILNR